MKNTIQLSSGSGSAQTKNAAFDIALAECGLHNQNITELSSVIPPDADILEVSKIDHGSRTGQEAVCVMSENIVQKDLSGMACSGIGWEVYRNGGVFTEEVGESEKEVRQKIEQSLEILRENRDKNEGDVMNKGEKFYTVESERGEITVSVVIAHYVTRELL